MTDYRGTTHNLTKECWKIQLHGTWICDGCPLRYSDQCNGQEIRKTGKNSKGFWVPVEKY